MGICQSLLYCSEEGDLYVSVHTTKFWREIQIHLDAASSGEAINVPASRRAKSRLIQHRGM